MKIRYKCPHCRQTLAASDRMAGSTVACPACRSRHVVPATASSATDDQPVRKVGQSAPAEIARDERYDVSGRDAPTGMRPDEQPPSGSFDDPGDDITDDDEEPTGVVIHRPERMRDELDLIPMVDCVFLLLVFYMITATYGTQRTIEVASHEAASASRGATQALQPMEEENAFENSIVVRIDDQNAIYVDDVRMTRAQDLADTLRARKIPNDGTELIVEVDGRASHEAFVEVIDIAQEFKFEKIQMASIGDNDP